MKRLSAQDKTRIIRSAIGQVQFRNLTTAAAILRAVRLHRPDAVDQHGWFDIARSVYETIESAVKRGVEVERKLAGK